MKLLIVGASGLVGWNLHRIAQQAGHEVVGTYSSYAMEGLIPLDLSGRDAVRALVMETFPDAIICCAAWSWVDGCESDPNRALRQNRDNPALLASLASEIRAQFVHYSTSYVFDGKDGPYSEDSRTKPISIYGESKLAGEIAVLEATSGKAIIARTMGVYGEEPQEKNFVYQVRRNLLSGKRMKIPNDQYGNATFAPDLARMTLKLVSHQATGLWNLAGPNPNLCRNDFALKIAESYKLDDSLLEFIETESLGQLAPRPVQAGLLISKFLNNHHLMPEDWNPFP